MERGDIYIANINPRSGSEQSGIRPILIISHNSFNTTQNWKSIIIVPISTSINQAKRSPTVVKILANESGLEKESSILCHQITTLDKSKITKKIGSISGEKMKEVERSIKYSLDIFE
ncbi:MAG: type II toxin-antitoxin system PemK/MazF family toxin [Candidatus Sericytochromatia bacterium]|nr:type II toxin-antitoxin system PemK/MazF family toxin [Candidatus Sericytochromatia bacterium]